MMMKISMDTLRQLNELSPDKKERVDAIVKRHVAACQRNGFLPENLERVFIEAMEMADLGEEFVDPKPTEPRTWEPVRSYEQYISPKAA